MSALPVSPVATLKKVERKSRINVRVARFLAPGLKLSNIYMNQQIRIRDLRQKEKFVMDDQYMNGYARLCGWKATITYCSLCRHANKDQYCFPPIELMAEENAVSRDTIIRGLKPLIDWNIVQIERERTPSGVWKNNAYVLVDKSQWKPKPNQVANSDLDKNNSIKIGQPSCSQRLDQVAHSDSKETHIKETHNSNTNVLLQETPVGYGNFDITFLVSFLKEKFQLPMLDGSEKTNRRYCWLAVRKFGGVDKVKLLIEIASKDSFWATRITSFKQIYYNGVQIISKIRGGSNGKPNIVAINPA